MRCIYDILIYIYFPKGRLRVREVTVITMMQHRHAQILSSNYDNIRTEGAAVYQMAPCTPSQMMGYVIRSADGKLFCIDGGTAGDTDGFLTLARRASGCPDGEKLHIDGWFLTHAHCDHTDVFYEAMRRCSDTFSLDHLYLNFPSADYQRKYEKNEAHTIDEYEAIRPMLADREVIVHTGDHFDFGDIVFDILTEPDESITVNTGNNTSVAIRVTLEEQRILFLGDMGVEEGTAMLARWPEEALRADVVEAAHHGQNGVDYPVYFAIRPRAVLWCTPDWLWRNDAGKGYGTGPWKTFHVRCCMEDLGVRHHFIEKDGIWEIPFPYDLSETERESEYGQ